MAFRVARRSMTNGTVTIGTAGWSLSSRHGDRFATTGTHLQRYAEVLNGVEINSSFYRPHRRATYERWGAGTPEHFRFSVKLPKSVTHERRLKGVEDVVERFGDEVGGLGGKLGVLLVQLPPSLPFDEAVAASFLDALRRIDIPPALEPRHPSWFTPRVDAFLASHGVARVAADPAPAPGAGEPGGWQGLVYLRLHGSPVVYTSDYEADALRAVERRLLAHRERGARVWCVFDNTAAGHALGNALWMAEALRPGRG